MGPLFSGITAIGTLLKEENTPVVYRKEFDGIMQHEGERFKEFVTRLNVRPIATLSVHLTRITTSLNITSSIELGVVYQIIFCNKSYYKNLIHSIHYPI